MKDDTQFNRLMKKLPDGSFKIAGYELWHEGLTYQAEQIFDIPDIKASSMLPTSYRVDFESDAELRAYVHNVYHIPHDRKDRYAFHSPLPDGIRGAYFKNDVDVFENDIIIWCSTEGEKFTKTVKWNKENACWCFDNIPYLTLRASGYFQTQIECIGIEGVS